MERVPPPPLTGGSKKNRHNYHTQTVHMPIPNISMGAQAVCVHDFKKAQLGKTIGQMHGILYF